MSAHSISTRTQTASVNLTSAQVGRENCSCRKGNTSRSFTCGDALWPQKHLGTGEKHGPAAVGPFSRESMHTAFAECLPVQIQSSSPDYGAKNFSDNAPSWSTLQNMVEDRARELDWQQPDLEEVCGNSSRKPMQTKSHTCTTHIEPPASSCLQKQVATSGPGILSQQGPVNMQGPTSPLALKRTFGQSGQPRVKLYRCFAMRRDAVHC